MRNNKPWFYICASAAGLLAGGLLFIGCASTPTAGGASPSSANSSTNKPVAWWKATQASKGGAELWGENCGRCHNVRSPGSFNDAQWEIAAMHMRERANLTGEEERKILQFLKSAD